MAMKMWKYINEILENFRNCFSRQASFQWFVVIVIGSMLRTDTLGVTSVIRDLALSPKLYETMLNFFRSSSWSLEGITDCWCQIVRKCAPVYMENGKVILVGDGVKQAKEARKMAGVKKLHQESENSSKAEYIFGHMFGAIGVLIGDNQKLFCVPLFINLQDGIKTICSWINPDERQESHIVQMIQNGVRMTKIFGQSILLLDRYFLSTKALVALKTLQSTGIQLLHILTKAKQSCVAYEKVHQPKSGKGRPRKKGKAIKLITLFETAIASFKKTNVLIYGKNEQVSYYCINLLWGQGLYQELRFVLVKYNGAQSILVTTDLTLSPEEIIRLYSYRFKIECTFRELKQVIGCFGYHFWSKSMPKLNRYLKKEDKNPIDLVEDNNAKKNIILTVKAIEGYVMCGAIALGLLQMIAVKFSTPLNQNKLRYLRTVSNQIASEATVAYYLRKNIFLFMAKTKYYGITKIINDKQMEPELCEDLEAS